ncbi:hypothetical protein D9M71_829240 [compost metagenome]
MTLITGIWRYFGIFWTRRRYGLDRLPKSASGRTSTWHMPIRVMRDWFCVMRWIRICTGKMRAYGRVEPYGSSKMGLNGSW